MSDRYRCCQVSFALLCHYITELPDQVFVLSELSNRHDSVLYELPPRMTEPSQMPQGQHGAFIWFTESQLRSVNGIVPEWFHGIISRKTAEELLLFKPPGYFLIRVSETRIGYTLSYRAADRCRHFMIDVVDGHYVILGENKRHRSLQELVDFHRRTPIVPFSEVLTVACGQAMNDKTDYAELLFPQRHPDTSLHPSTSHPASQGEIPPALPYRPNNLRNSAVPCPSTLYPCLDEEFPHVTAPLPATPAPMTRKSYSADSPPSNQPPAVPARSSVPLLKQNQACIRTVSAPASPTAHTTPEHSFGADIQPAKNQEAKLSVVTNLKNLKKKFQKRRSVSQESASAESNVEATDRSGNPENEYQEITGKETFNRPTFSYTCPNVRMNDGELPQEYRPPPPFAPGY